MEGAISWAQLSYITGVIVLVSGFMFGFAWKMQELRARDMAEMSEITQMVQKDLDSRLRTIEIANAGTLVVLKHLEDFRKEINERLEAMQDDRSEDMELLYKRLDAMKIS